MTVDSIAVLSRPNNRRPFQTGAPRPKLTTLYEEHDVWEPRPRRGIIDVALFREHERKRTGLRLLEGVVCIRSFCLVDDLLLGGTRHDPCDRTINCASSVRAAGALKQFGALIFGFQNSGSSNDALHERSMKHTDPFFPFTASS